MIIHSSAKHNTYSCVFWLVFSSIIVLSIAFFISYTSIRTSTSTVLFLWPGYFCRSSRRTMRYENPILWGLQRAKSKGEGNTRLGHQLLFYARRSLFLIFFLDFNGSTQVKNQMQNSHIKVLWSFIISQGWLHTETETWRPDCVAFFANTFTVTPHHTCHMLFYFT